MNISVERYHESRGNRLEKLKKVMEGGLEDSIKPTIILSSFDINKN